MAWIVEVKPAWNVAPGEPGEDTWVPAFYMDPTPERATVETEPEARALAKTLELVMTVAGLDGVGWREFRWRELPP